ncbi:3,4-dioxygenase subunit beta [uncultured Nocardioides sp.]|uniref:dioxygenase family protein n=1 Tax=uncultured Nocardioides sp. TaxID=198441 RepID=UPI002631D275|nr:3,4-dioxygenase subunit beta [uncultured Nocardioides sp.]
MPQIPEPDRTPDGPTYEGRLLTRPDDEVVDQGAGFDVRTLVTRRRLLGLVGVGVGAAALAACGASGSSGSGSSSSASSATTSAGEIPEETNGPYPADGTADLNILEDSGIVRSDITSSLDGGTTVDGVPLELTFAVTDAAKGDAPFEGVAVYAWQCDAEGRYSMYSSGVEDETYLRGVQVADADGEVTFTTIVPGCYAGRWTHIHFEVYPDAASATDVAHVIATSQLAFPPDVLADVYSSTRWADAYAGSTENLAGVGTQVSDDGLFGEGDWELQVPEISGDPTAGYTARLAVAVDTTTEPSSGGMGGMGGGPGDGGPGGGEPPSGPPPGSDS